MLFEKERIFECVEAEAKEHKREREKKKIEGSRTKGAEGAKEA